MARLSRPGFKVILYETLEEFYLAEALEYIAAWKQSTSDNPVGICGPIGPTEQLPLVARLCPELGHQSELKPLGDRPAFHPLESLDLLRLAVDVTGVLRLKNDLRHGLTLSRPLA